MKILAFGFKENASGRIVEKLSVNRKSIIASNEDDIRAYVADVDLEGYDFIIGVGSYSGTDKDKIRIETICTSQFRNDKDNLEQIELRPFFKVADGFKIATHMGNSYCNLVSYLIMNKYPDMQLTFLHIPNDFPSELAAFEINKQIEMMKL